MARMDLDKMSIADLRGLITAAQSAIQRKTVEQRHAVKAQISQLVAASGFSVQELFGGRGNGAGIKVAPKYRNPDNPDEIWTGRGRQPRWLVAALKKGGKLERFLIK